MVPLIGGAHCGDHNFQARPGARAAGIRPGDDALEQWSPTFLARGADFMEDNFSMGQRGAAPSQPATWESEAEGRLCVVMCVHVEQVVSSRRRDSKGEGTKPRCFRWRGPSGHFCPPLLLNRIASYSQGVLRGWDLPRTICGRIESCAFLSLVVSGLYSLRSQKLLPSGLCCLGRSPLLHLSCQQSMSLTLQIQL